MDDTDDELMRRIGHGDRQAFGRLVGLYVDRASALAGRVTGNRSDAEEVVQEAFLRVWLKAPQWRERADHPEGARFGTWFYRVLVNLCVDRKRRPGHDPLDAAGEVADHARSAAEIAEGNELGRRVTAAIGTLPEHQRTALSLCYYDEVTNIEAAEIMGLSVGAIESLLVRARRSLKVALADLAGPPSIPAAKAGRP